MTTKPTKFIPPTPKSFSDCKDWSDLLVWSTANKVFPNLFHRMAFLGNPGTAKSTLSWKLGEQYWPSVYRITLHRKLRIDHLIGNWRIAQENGASVTRFVPGPAIRAFMEGGLLIIEEIDQFSPDTFTLLHALLDDVDIANIPLPDGTTVRPSPGFAVIANTNDHDLLQHLPQALADRLDVVCHADTISRSFYDNLNNSFSKEFLEAAIPSYVRHHLDNSKRAVAVDIVDRPSTPRSLIPVNRIISQGALTLKDALTLTVGSEEANRLARIEAVARNS